MRSLTILLLIVLFTSLFIYQEARWKYAVVNMLAISLGWLIGEFFRYK